MAYVEAPDGTPLYVKDWGTGTPIVLVGGWPLSADMWEYNAVPLAEAGLRVIAYDRRGFGRSGQPWGGYDYDTMADDLAAVLEALDVRGATLVGFSMGGGEVARYCGRGPSAHVARAVLVSAVTPYLLKGADNPDGVDKSVFDGFVEKLREDRPGFLASFGKVFFGTGLLDFSVSSALLEWAQGMALQASPRATIACVRAFSETDFRGDCGRIGVPTLIIHGDADATVPIAASARKAVGLIPGSELIEYAGAPHALMYTARERLNQDLLRFAGG